MISLLAILGCAACYTIGYVLGMHRGADEQWVNDFIEAGRREAARRDSHGRFKPAGRN